MKNRILGLSYVNTPSSLPVVLVHAQNNGETLVNGRKAKILLLPPKEKVNTFCEIDESDFLIIRLSKGVFPLEEGDFVSFSKGGVLLQVAEQNDIYSICKVVKEGFLVVSEPLEKWKPMKVAVLTVSDKGSRGERKDTSGPALKDAVIDIGGLVKDSRIVPDEQGKILEVIRSWISSEYELILITGGTGLSPRDVTPESLLKLEGKEVPGIGEYMRWRTSYYTLRSILSRCMAKAVGKSLIIALPGSKKAVLECFYAVAPVIRHAVEIITGKAGECAHNHN